MENRIWQRIKLGPNICYRKPCIRGLGYPVELILELCSPGSNSQQIIIDEYDDLEDEGIHTTLL
jgi:uncharacterized protein (DUF433 family)